MPNFMASFKKQRSYPLFSEGRVLCNYDEKTGQLHLKIISKYIGLLPKSY